MQIRLPPLLLSKPGKYSPNPVYPRSRKREEENQSQPNGFLLLCFKEAGIRLSLKKKKKKWDLHLVLHIFMFPSRKRQGFTMTISTARSDHRSKIFRKWGSLYSHPRTKEHLGNKTCFVTRYPKNSPLCLFTQSQKNPTQTHIHFFMEMSSWTQEVFRLWAKKYCGSALHAFLPVCVSTCSYLTC